MFRIFFNFSFFLDGVIYIDLWWGLFYAFNLVDQEEHQIEVVKAFEKKFVESVSAVSGIEIKVLKSEIVRNQPFDFEDSMTTFLDLNGSIIGYIAIVCSEESAAKLLDVEAVKENRLEYGSFLSEVLNITGGTLAEIIEKKHPIATIAAPKLAFGSFLFPNVESCTIKIETDFGAFDLCYATDCMALKIINLLNSVKHQKNEIKLILDNVPSALLTFNLDGVIGSENSSAARKLLGDDVSGKKIFEIVYKDDDQREEMISLLDMLPYSPLPFDEAMELAPKGEILWINDKRVDVKYNYAPIYKDDQHEELDRVMLIIDDITEEVRLKEESKIRDEKANFIHKVLKSRESYISFLSETNDNIKVLTKELQHVTKDSIQVAFRAGHTIKGNSSIFGISELRDSAHRLESSLMDLRDQPDLEITNEVVVDITNKHNALIQTFNRHIKETEQLFGDRFDPRKDIELRYELHESRLDYLLTLTDDPKLLNELEKIKLKKIYIFLAPYEDLIYNLSKKLGKNINPLQLQGESTLIKPDRWSAFFANFVHLIRNCVDHGIETPDERELTEKPVSATISIDVVEEENGITIHLKDDGRGISPDKVADAALSKGIITQEELDLLSDSEKQLLIFRPGFSTNEDVTTLSGRGVGMDAMKFEVDQLGGSFKLDSQFGVGTTFSIYVPYSKSIDQEDKKEVISQKRRIFKRLNTPLYLPVFRGDGLVGHIINISPDGFRLVSKDNHANNEEHAVIVYLDHPSDSKNSIWVSIKFMNHLVLDNGLIEHGCLIKGFERDGDEERYELAIRHFESS